MQRHKNQTGLASIVVVFVLVIVLSLISIGFTKIINRGTQSSTNSQLAAAASAAAQSGITETANYIKNHRDVALSATDCKANLTLGLGPINASFGASSNTKYTCLLADKTPPNLQYQKLPPYKSLVVKLEDNSGLSITKLMFSWQSTDRTKNKFVPSGLGTKLFDETYWTSDPQNYAPLLRVSLYPIFSPDTNLANTKSNTKTFFLYPQTGSQGNISLIHYTSSAGGLSAVNCNATGSGTFIGATDGYDCSMIIDTLPNSPSAPSAYYAQITPLYDQTNIQIRANNANNTVTKFKDAQAVVDVTANSGGASKRLQARVDISKGTTINPDDNAIPDNALRSAATICKRLVVSGNNVKVDESSVADCGLTIEPPPAPVVTLTASQPSVSPSSPSSTLTWGSSNATSCHAPWTNGGNPTGTSGSQIVSPTVTTTYTMTCDGPGGSAPSPPVQITYIPAPSKLTVNVIGIGKVTAAIQDSGLAPQTCDNPSISPKRCTFTYPASTKLNLNAAPGSSSVFAGWSGDCSGTALQCNPFPLIMNANKTVTADFATIVINPDATRICTSAPGSTQQTPFYNNPVVQVTTAGFNGPVSLSSNYAPGVADNGNLHNPQPSYSFSPASIAAPGNGTSTITLVAYKSTKNYYHNHTPPYLAVTITATTTGGQTVSVTLFVTIHDCNGSEPYCTDPGASNFLQEAPCQYPAGGGPICMDVQSPGYGGPLPCPPVTPPPTCDNPGAINFGGPLPCQLPGPCFGAGTLILLPDGRQKPIEDIRPGDVVESYDVNQHQMVSGTVSQTFVHTGAQTYVLKTTAGTIVTTANHPFWTGNKWVEAGDLKLGTQLLDDHGKTQMAMGGFKGPQATVYNLEVDNPNHNYFAGGILVHNKIPPG